MDTDSIHGVVLVCDQEGRVRDILFDDLGLSQVATNNVFIQLLDASSYSKGLQFLNTLTTSEPVLDWELCFSIGNKPCPMKTAGLLDGEDKFIMAANSGLGLRSLCQSLAAGNPDRAELYTRIASGWEQLERRPDDADVYTDFMRMYNDFARLQREVAGQNAQLQRLSAEKDRLLDMAAHDLRNPLNVIGLLAQGLMHQAQARLTTQDQDCLQRIQHTAQAMGQLINEILGRARNAPGTPKIELRQGDMLALLRSRLELLRPLADNKEIQFRLDVPQQVSKTYFDVSRMQQVIDNILGNAIKFSPLQSVISLTLAQTGHGLLITISDAGPGVPEQELEAIFDPFVKGSSNALAHDAGNGLGLAICRSIMDAHGGRIWAENRHPQGLSMNVLLPFAGTA